MKVIIAVIAAIILSAAFAIGVELWFPDFDGIEHTRMLERQPSVRSERERFGK